MHINWVVAGFSMLIAVVMTVGSTLIYINHNPDSALANEWQVAAANEGL